MTGRYRRAFEAAATAFIAQPFLPATRPLWLRIARWAASATTIFAALTALVAPILTFTNELITIDIPVQTFWPQLPRGASIEGMSAGYVSGGFDTAHITSSGLDVWTRAWLALSQTSFAVTVTVVAFALMMLCTRILDDETPFARSVTRAVSVSGRAIIIGGIVTQVSGGVASGLASSQVLRYIGAHWNNVIHYDDLDEIIGVPTSNMVIGFDYWPVVIGVILLVLAAVFRYGEQLQERSAELERDTQGLV